MAGMDAADEFDVAEDVDAAAAAAVVADCEESPTGAALMEMLPGSDSATGENDVGEDTVADESTLENGATVHCGHLRAVSGISTGAGDSS